MSYRLTNTEKWNDSWFCSLKPIDKLLFLYLCDNCNLAGFIEFNSKKWAFDLGTDKKNIEGGLKGVQRGIIWSSDLECIYIRNFLKHQKNYPFNEKNKAHLSILRLFSSYSYKFNIQNVNEFIEGGCKGLATPTGNGIGNSINNKEVKTWKNSFEIYLSECKNGYEKFMTNDDLIKKQERLNPGIDIKLSIEKGFTNYWSTDAGWKKKKASRSNDIDWQRTIISSIDFNKVYLPRK
jgi:hypothetical protein